MIDALLLSIGFVALWIGIVLLLIVVYKKPYSPIIQTPKINRKPLWFNRNVIKSYVIEGPEPMLDDYTTTVRGYTASGQDVILWEGYPRSKWSFWVDDLELTGKSVSFARKLLNEAHKKGG